MAFLLANLQAPDIFGMFRKTNWWGCELAMQNTSTGYAPDYANAAVITGDSVFKALQEMDYQLSTGAPVAPDSFCLACPPNATFPTDACGRWVHKLSTGWLYTWVLYWTITTMTRHSSAPPSFSRRWVSCAPLPKRMGGHRHATTRGPREQAAEQRLQRRLSKQSYRRPRRTRRCCL